MAGLAQFDFVPASLLRFAQEAAPKVKLLAQDVAEKLRACEANHADETYCRIDGQPACVWFHGNEDLAHFCVCGTRSGKVSRMSDHSKTTSIPTFMAELGCDNADQELTFSLLGSDKATLDQIEVAIQRIEDGSYGRCEECGEQIPETRLEAMPYAAAPLFRSFAAYLVDCPYPFWICIYNICRCISYISAASP